MSAIFSARLTRDEYTARLRAIEKEESGDLSKLIEAAELDPKRDLRFGDLAHCKLDGDDVRGFDFTGCDLSGATFDKTLITGAVFDLAAVRPGQLQAASDFEDWFLADLDRVRERRNIDPRRLADLDTFREAPFAPEMVVIPAGEFLMGSDESDAYPDERMPDGKKRRMVIPERFALGKYPVTFEEYLLFCAETKRRKPRDFDWGRGRRPIVDVTWDDANAYARWINERLGVEAYGLPSEAEFEYACRAGSDTRYWWGDAWNPSRANGDRSFEGGRTSPVGGYGENPLKLADMIGNVREWQADVWTGKFVDLPADGSPYGPPTTTRGRERKKMTEESPARALRGGSWNDYPRDLRSAFRNNGHPGNSGEYVGFRLSRTLRS